MCLCSQVHFSLAQYCNSDKEVDEKIFTVMNNIIKQVSSLKKLEMNEHE